VTLSFRTILPALAAALLIAILFYLAYHSQHVLEQGLPERIVCASQADALAQAGRGAYPVLGTGSMAPYIPAAPAGQDPLKTVVAYAVASGAGYDAITPGALCIYRPTWANPTGLVIHCAAQKDSDGWIMSGLHNKQSESWARVTPANFVAIVAHAYVW
jgi:hypothetical protein